MRGSYKWVDILPNLVKDYNGRVHRTIGIKPQDLTSKDEARILKKLSFKLKKLKAKFKKGDKVRISKAKHVFEKRYTPNFGTEIFTVVRVARTNPVTYHIKDYKEEPIAGGFYEQELTKVKYPDVYLVEKVLKRRKNQIYVKWLGFDNSHNSWINKE